MGTAYIAIVGPEGQHALGRYRAGSSRNGASNGGVRLLARQLLALQAPHADGFPLMSPNIMLHSSTLRILVAPMMLVLACEASVIRAACMEAPPSAHEHDHGQDHGSEDAGEHANACEMPCCDRVLAVETACSTPPAPALSAPASLAAALQQPLYHGIRRAVPSPASRGRPPNPACPPKSGRQALLSTFLI